MIVNESVASLETLALAPDTVVFIDADSCAFPFQDPEPYEDALELRARVPYMALVTANPDTKLMERRAERLGVDYSLQARGIPVWFKANLYAKAAKAAFEHEPFQNAVVLDDRWFAGVIAAKIGIQRAVGVDAHGVLVKRDCEAPSTQLDRFIVRPFETISYAGACGLRMAGLGRAKTNL